MRQKLNQNSLKDARDFSENFLTRRLWMSLNNSLANLSNHVELMKRVGVNFSLSVNPA